MRNNSIYICFRLQSAYFNEPFPLKNTHKSQDVSWLFRIGALEVMDVEVCTSSNTGSAFTNAPTVRIFCVLPRSDIFNTSLHRALYVKTFY